MDPMGYDAGFYHFLDWHTFFGLPKKFKILVCHFYWVNGSFVTGKHIPGEIYEITPCIPYKMAYTWGASMIHWFFATPIFVDLFQGT